MTRYLAFDIETVKPFPEDHNWRSVRPMGIACAAAYGVGDENPGPGTTARHPATSSQPSPANRPSPWSSRSP